MKSTLIMFIILLITLRISFPQTYNLRAIIHDEGGKIIDATGNYRAGLSVGQQLASNCITSGNYRAVIGFWNPVTGPLIGIKEKDFQIVSISQFVFSLSQCYPNPFNNRTVIRYSLPKETDVNLKVFNTTGRVVRTLFKGKQKPGTYNIIWNLKGVSQSQLPNGVYFYRLETNEFIATKKMIKAE